MKLTALFLLPATAVTAFVNQQSLAFHRQIRTQTQTQRSEALMLHMAKKVGIFFGTSTGSTENAAYEIMEALGDEVVSEPIEIDGLAGKVAATFQEYDSLIVGTPTWNTGADVERSGTGWDELYYGEMQDLNLQGKKVAVFGLGDSVSYAENYADASGELHDVFEKLGCKLFGYTSQEGYEHEESKAIRGDKFCGLLLDAVNQEELTEERVKNWVAQLIGEGFLEAGSSSPSATQTPATSTNSPSAPPSGSLAAALEELVKENAKLRQMLETNSDLLKDNIVDDSDAMKPDENGFMPHLNPSTGNTMWTSADGKTCYYTTIDPKISSYKP